MSTPQLSPENSKLIEKLRLEALSVKDCAARYTQQTMMFSGAALFGIGATMQHSPYAALACIPLLYVLRAISLTNTHKTSTANRNFGYELHLEKSLNYSDEPNGWQHHYRDIGWEEAMHAWRIFQASVYEELCEQYPRAPVYKQKYRPEIHKNPWYIVKAEVVYGTTYYAGSAVKKYILLIRNFMYAALIPLLLFAFALAMPSANNISEISLISATNDTNTFRGSKLELGLVVMAIMYAFWFVIKARKHDDARLLQLEEGILSIPTCALMWKYVVISHFRALQTNKKDYSRRVSIEASKFIRYMDSIEDWYKGIDQRGLSRKELYYKKIPLEQNRVLSSVDLINVTPGYETISFFRPSRYSSNLLLQDAVIGDDQRSFNVTIINTYKKSKGVFYFANIDSSVAAKKYLEACH